MTRQQHGVQQNVPMLLIARRPVLAAPCTLLRGHHSVQELYWEKICSASDGITFCCYLWGGGLCRWSKATSLTAMFCSFLEQRADPEEGPL